MLLFLLQSAYFLFLQTIWSYLCNWYQWSNCFHIICNTWIKIYCTGKYETS